MAAEGIWAMAKARLDQVAAKVAVHAVVGPLRNVARISLGIDLHAEVPALTLLPALHCREEFKITLRNSLHGLARRAQRPPHACTTYNNQEFSNFGPSNGLSQGTPPAVSQ